MSEDIHAEALERYNRTAQALWDNLYGWDAVPVNWPVPPFSIFRDRFPRRDDPEQKRLAEERDRHQWIEGVKRRLGLVCIGEMGYLLAYETHRCRVWRCGPEDWGWYCLRRDCAELGHFRASWDAALADALTHSRDIFEVAWAAYEKLAGDARAEEKRNEEVVFPLSMNEALVKVNDDLSTAGLLPEGMRFEWE